MKKLSSLLLVITLLVTSCGGGEKGNDLASKKAELAKLQKEQADLNGRIKDLQAAISKADPNKTVKTINVTVMPLVAQNFQHFIEATGRLEAKNNQYVSPQMGGAITNVFVREGDFVGKGQRIATIDNSILRTSMQEIQIQLETARTIYEKQKTLWDQKIGTEIQYIQAKTQVEALEKRLATMRAQDRLNVVVSPIAGYVDEVRMKAGELAAPGLGIVRVVNTNDLKVVANVPDTYAGTVAKGDVVKIKFPDLQKELQTRLTFVSQTINPANRTFIIEAQIPRDPQLKPNLMAVLQVNDQSRASVLVVPQNLIQRNENGQVVFVAVQEGQNRVARSRQVTLGLTHDGKVEVTSGLSAGEMLITEGYQDLVDGQVVTY